MLPPAAKRRSFQAAVSAPPRSSALPNVFLPQVKLPVAVLGFNTAEDVFYENEFKALGVQTVIATADGSCGTRGFVTDALPEQFDTGLRLRADADAQGALCKNGQARPDQSEKRAWAAASAPAWAAPARPSRDTSASASDGPVMRKEEILWEA